MIMKKVHCLSQCHPTYIWSYTSYLYVTYNESNKRRYISNITLKYDKAFTISGCSHFYPRPVLAFGYCRCLRLSVCVSVRPSVCVCGKHLLVRAITQHPFKLGSPNLDNRCKIPWLISYCFGGWLTLTFKVKLNSKVKIYPILRLCMP